MSEEGKKTIPETVNEENSTTGYVASIQPCALHSNRYFKGYDGARSYEDTPPYGSSHSRQNDWSYDYGQEDRSRASGPPGSIKNRLVPSEPSPHVIFLGLDPDFTEADVCRLLMFLNTIIPMTEVVSY